MERAAGAQQAYQSLEDLIGSPLAPAGLPPAAAVVPATVTGLRRVGHPRHTVSPGVSSSFLLVRRSLGRSSRHGSVRSPVLQGVGVIRSANFDAAGKKSGPGRSGKYPLALRKMVARCCCRASASWEEISSCESSI